MYLLYLLYLSQLPRDRCKFLQSGPQAADASYQPWHLLPHGMHFVHSCCGDRRDNGPEEPRERARANSLPREPLGVLGELFYGPSALFSFSDAA